MKLPVTPPDFLKLVRDLPNPNRWLEIISAGFGPEPSGEYLHWDNLRHRPPPAGYSLEEWWLGVKTARTNLSRPLPFQDKTGRVFQLAATEGLQRRLHLIDQQIGAAVVTTESELLNPDTRDRYLVNSLFEEAITSSQLEGAATTKLVAKEMLRTGRKPRDTGERMIVNNYTAMQFIRGVRDQPITPELIRELHRIVCDGTLDNPAKLGQWREESDPIQVVDHRDGVTLHIPPPALELEHRMAALCAFANEKALDVQSFIHPVLRAALLHFMIGYDHPFVDGNGRTARAVFYLSMARQRYWLMEFLSISSVLNRAPSQYTRAYLHTETDSADTTYFLIHQCDVILKAAQELHSYVGEKARQQRRVDAMLRVARGALLNHRQTALLAHAIRHPAAVYTVQSHQRSHNVTYETARTDLGDLVSRGFLNQEKRGRKFEYRVPADLESRLQQPATPPGR